MDAAARRCCSRGGGASSVIGGMSQPLVVSLLARRGAQRSCLRAATAATSKRSMMMTTRTTATTTSPSYSSSVITSCCSAVITRRFSSSSSSSSSDSPTTDASNICHGKRPIKQALVITKTSRYCREAERLSLSGPALHAEMTRMGLAVDTLLASRDMHEQGVLSLLAALHRSGIESRLIRHTNFECLESDDVVISAGGDGTFLQSARRIGDGGPPILGVNTDSRRSKGFFCRLDASKAECLDLLIPRLVTGDFQFKKRSRIKVTLCDSAGEVYESIPYVLNEVFFAEKDASKPSQLAMSFDGGVFTAHKSSGVIVATGSGCTAWIANVARISSDQVAAVIHALGQPALPPSALHELTRKVNRERLVLRPEDAVMQYIIREPLRNRQEIDTHPNFGKAQRIGVRSLGDNAVLTADGIGNVAVPPGVVVDLSMCSSGTLNCITFPQHPLEM